MLRLMVTHAYENVPFYHKRFTDAAKKPSDIRTASDLTFLGVIRKQDIRNNVERMIAKGVEKGKLLRIETSGSTGLPLTLYVSRDEDDFRKVKHLRDHVICGHKATDRWVVISMPTRFQAVGLLQRSIGFYSPRFVSVFEDPAKQVSRLEELKPEILDGYSTSILLIAKEMEKRGITAIRPRMIFTGAELLDAHSRKKIERSFDCPSYDQYATIELERIAWQCLAKTGYHMDSDALIVQFVDKEGEEVAKGESGEILCTSLFNYSMPLIRYSVGDIGSWTDERCSCGINLPLMKVLEGRRDSIIILPDGRMLSPITFICAMDLYKFFGHIDQFKLIQKRPDYIEVVLVRKDDSIGEKALQTELVSHLNKSLELDVSEVTFDVHFVDKIPLEASGKLTSVTTELKRPI